MNIKEVRKIETQGFFSRRNKILIKEKKENKSKKMS